ncbi:MAG: HAMP domain-containing sensor histidine kinase [Streptosporangiaceae bacterium]
MTSGPARLWKAARGLPDRTPLRVKLISAVLALVALALAVISLTGITVIRHYLLSRADEQLQTLYLQALQFGGRAPRAPSPDQWVYEALTPPDTVSRLPGGLLPTGTPGPAVVPEVSWLAANPGKARTVAATSGNSKWRIAAYPDFPFITTTGTPVSGTLVIGLDVTSVYSTLGQLIAIDILVSVLVVLVLAILGIALVRASLRPLDEIEQTARGIAAGDLTRRVPDRDPRTEVGRLGRSLNAMLSQIEVAFRARSESEEAARGSEQRMRQFVADASHELRTPLTTIRGFAEYYRQRGGIDDGRLNGGGGRGGSGSGGHEGLEAPADPAHELSDVGTATAGTGQAGALIQAGGPAAGTDMAGAHAADAHAASTDAAESSRGGQLTRIDLDRIMRRVEQESTRMGVLVEDMLMLARLDQQRPLESRPVDLLTLAADAVHDARVMAPGRSIDLTVGAGAAMIVIGDETRLRQVIGNLMSNALVHTPDGTPVQVRIRSGFLDETAPGAGPAAVPAPAAVPPPPAAAVPAPAAVPPPPAGPPPAAVPAPAASMAAAALPAVVLEVADQGPGLTPDQAERAFERFYRADQARTRQAGGTGLGLAIVAALVTAHGGTVRVDTSPGSGATFRIALPMAPEARGHTAS